jgi:Tfp pilus assembly protein PilF
MKVLTKISVLLITVLSLTVGFCYGQSVNEKAIQSYILIQGLEQAAQGNFNEAKVIFKKALKVDPDFESAKRVLKAIEDVSNQKIKSETAIRLFKGISYWIFPIKVDTVKSKLLIL